MRVWFCFLIWIAVALPLAAQDNAQADKGLIVNWLEENLSDAGRQITIDGFSGALSSQAHLDRMTISDDAGPWLVLENARLIWQRSALFNGRIEVEELSADTLHILRLPQSTASGPRAEASPPRAFSLPELPVAVHIGRLAIAQVRLDAPVLGEALRLSVSGSAALEGGEGQAHLSLDRTDGHEGHISLAGSYANQSRALLLSFSTREGAGGILARLAHLPDAPSLAVSVDGKGTLPRFDARISLETNGAQRLQGTVQLEQPGDSGALNFGANLSGNITPLLAPQYRRFFGPHSQLSLNGAMKQDGSMALQSLRAKTAALSVKGSLFLLPGGAPDKFDLRLHLGENDAKPVQLPIPGVQVTSGEVDAHFDAAHGKEWSLAARLDGWQQAGFAAKSMTLAATGTINAPQGRVQAVTARLTAQSSGMEIHDDFMRAALGTAFVSQAKLGWKYGEPLQINSFSLNTDQASLAGSGQISGLSAGFRVEGKASVETGSLARFTSVSPLPLLDGSARLALQGWWQPAQGAFDAMLKGTTRALKFPKGSVLAVMRGNGHATASLGRDIKGLHLRYFSLNTDLARANVSGDLSSDSGHLRAKAALSDVSVLANGISGPASMSAQLQRQKADQPWSLRASASGPGGARLLLDGTAAPDFTRAKLRLTGAIALGLANTFLPPSVNTQGRAELDLRLDGPLSVDALTGTVRTDQARVSLPDYNIQLRNISAAATIHGANATVSASGQNAAGGGFTAKGTQELAPPFASDIGVALENFALALPPTFTSTANGNLRVSSSQIKGTINFGPTEIRLIPAAGAAEIPPITHIAESPSVFATRKAAGAVQPASPNAATRPITLDILLRAPSRVFIRGRGLDAELGGEMSVTGTSENVTPSGRFDLVRGRLDLLGKRLQMREGWLTFRGSFEPDFDLSATTHAGETEVSINVAGNPRSPVIRFHSSPDLPEDEILALLLFGKDVTKISALQAAQLANAVSTLTGSGREGIVGKLRSRFGLDDLDITTTQNGSVAARAGKYISEKTYAEITADSGGRTEIDLNLNISPNLTLRGKAASDGETGVGLFFEKDY